MPRDTDRSHLHPVFRVKLADLDAALASAGLPLQLFEAGRAPQRQQELYAQGRISGCGTFGKHVTNAKPWQSFHQFGLAADYVFFVDGKWTWNEPTPGAWARYTEIAAQVGLRSLSFERPHVELPVPLTSLQAGRYPDGGDQAWIDWLDAMVESWGSAARTVDGIVYPGAPPMPTADLRPPLVASNG